MRAPDEPTSEQCSARAPVEYEGRRGFATFYPQMGGYVGRCVVLLVGNEGCFDAFVWHDGEWPFGDGPPVELHHCDPGQFIAFGREVLEAQGKAAT